jgi:hypothetical protein
MYRSKLERRTADMLLQERIPFDYEATSLQFTMEHTYTPDWRFVDLDGIPFFIETKGYFRPEQRSTMLAFRRSHPLVRLIVALQAPKQVLKGMKKPIAKWCEQNAIPWCPAPPPAEFIRDWINGNPRTYRFDTYTGAKRLTLPT